MALRGRHRRYQPNRINRASLTVTAGGAGLALPLIAAGTAAGAATGAAAAAATGTGTHAGPADAPRAHPASGDARTAVPGKALDASAHDVRPQTTPQSRAGRTAMYTVVRGDTLSGIADEHHVRGGWRKLYAGNRATVGADPDLILPGERLSLHPSKEPAGSARSPKGKATSQPAGPKVHHRTKSHPARSREPGAQTGTEAGTGVGAQALVAPVHAPIGTGYHVPGPYWSKGYHTGVDFLVPTGTAVHAAAAGRVVAAGWGGSYGYQVVIRHADGRYTQYGHLSAISVRTGRQVAAGARIARSGATGNVTGPHLHFEVRTGPGFGADIDPLAYLRAHGVRI
ncbi:peptidase [Streptomyces hygroscopicus subsp. hygroscopicus]|nr:peptidoglycan DD-metalloendopeptidase family protein [Streptomyces hygroscopicus]GLX50349.1 peptidase [Streptomyces hygroscopicus subsp. hygroscopicus]